MPNKTRETSADVAEFLDGVKNDTRRRDGRTAARIMESVCGVGPRMWGPSIVGFGKRQYTLANGRPEEICKVGFSPRANALVFYLGSFDDRPALLKKLGKHREGNGGCIYVNKLEDVDLEVLTTIIERAYRRPDAQPS